MKLSFCLLSPLSLHLQGNLYVPRFQSRRLRRIRGTVMMSNRDNGKQKKNSRKATSTEAGSEVLRELSLQQGSSVNIPQT